MNWIKISDQLPEDFQEVIWTNGSEVFVGFFEKSKEYGSIVRRLSYCCERERDELNNLTHWMPLPQP